MNGKSCLIPISTVELRFKNSQSSISFRIQMQCWQPSPVLNLMTINHLKRNFSRDGTWNQTLSLPSTLPVKRLSTLFPCNAWVKVGIRMVIISNGDFACPKIAAFIPFGVRVLNFVSRGLGSQTTDAELCPIARHFSLHNTGPRS